MEAKIVELEDMEVFFVRHIGPYEECKPAWDALCSWAIPKGAFRPGIKVLSLSHDDPKVTPPEKIRFDACIEADSSITPDAPVSQKTIEGGRYITTIHHGPYSGLAESYSQLCGQWAPQNGCEAASKASIEVYVNNPDETAPEDLITEIYVPVK